jgi:PAS domain S-box-containing protein
MATDTATETVKMGSKVPPHVDAGVVTLKANHTVVAWNARAAHLTGYTLEAINALGFLQTFEPVDTMQQLIQKAQEGISTASARVQLRRADGQFISLDVECSPLLPFEHGEERIVVAMRELAPSQESFCSGTRLLMLNHLARSVSHEIRNPLNAIFLHVDIIEEELRQPELETCLQVKQSLATVKAEVVRLHELVGDYLSLARLPDLRREPEDLRAFLEALAQEVQSQMAARGVTLHVGELGGLGVVALHRSTLRRALLNLMLYAMDATPQGGNLTLRGWRTTSHVHLVVHDMATILQADQLSLLQSSCQATELEGSALLFYVVQEIVAAHGGTMAVTSEPGKGTTFNVTLPVNVTDAPGSL